MTPLKHGWCALACGAAASLWLPLAAAALAETGMEWQFFQAPEPDYKSTRLIYGVPETDYSGPEQMFEHLYARLPRQYAWQVASLSEEESDVEHHAG